MEPFPTLINQLTFKNYKFKCYDTGYNDTFYVYENLLNIRFNTIK